MHKAHLVEAWHKSKLSDSRHLSLHLMTYPPNNKNATDNY